MIQNLFYLQAELHKHASIYSNHQNTLLISRDYPFIRQLVANVLKLQVSKVKKLSVFKMKLKR
jgi:hypothetical protein